jgi:CRISPR-associated endonuclease/helicase Cas3
MSALTFERFDDYFQALHGYPPYSWQQRLARSAIAGDWPGAIDLPTGSGKTACIDIAVFGLACQAGRPMAERNAPRRLFFCVNRRVIVDEAHQRATRIARAIWNAEREGARDKLVLCEVAAALRELAGTNAGDDVPPLDVLELRGGIFRDNRWARSVVQPTVVCTTIDQVGSRLLFRGYGVSRGAAPIQAALIAYDSLFLLDEAHISEPFRQTLASVQRYLDPERWAEVGLGVRPVCFVPMTATPPAGVKAGDVIRIQRDDQHDPRNKSLMIRMHAGKPAALREAKDVVADTARTAADLAKGKPAAVGVFLNRVATARRVYATLQKDHPDAAVELVIGSMRPIDRDDQAARLRDWVGPRRPAVTTRTSFIVTTQCLEVGADYDFDALVTECASLDALRQRFGRLNRGGRAIEARAIILAQKDNIIPDNKLDDKTPIDSVYGNAAARTWNWLFMHSQNGSVDFGIDAFNALLRKHGDKGQIPADLLAPSAKLNAPVMLPVYLDFWCQTAPHPVPDPDISLFLHGPKRGEPDVQVCWRADLGEGDDYTKPEQWADFVALLPPTSTECMSVPISRVRRWLIGEDGAPAKEADADLLGVSEYDENKEENGAKRRQPERPPVLKHRGLLWRGARDSCPLASPDDLRPGDTLVLPCSIGGWEALGHLPQDFSDNEQGLDIAHIDCAESAFLVGRRRIAFRIHPVLRCLWPQGAAVETMFRRLADRHDRPTTDELRGLLRDAADAVENDDNARSVLLRELAEQGNLLREEYPDGRGAILMSRRRRRGADDMRLPALDDGEDEPSRTRREEPVTLADHSAHVVKSLDRALTLLPTQGMAEAFRLAAAIHDLGKADERFQAMLRRADRTDAWLLAGLASTLLAKSDGLPQTRAEQDTARRRAALPDGFRHEMLSVLLAVHSTRLPGDSTERDLVSHLIAAHHGHARPFAPVVIDDAPPDVEVDGMKLAGADRLAHPAHRLDSGIAERFWGLTRHFGWWGLAYLESLLRLADQEASAAEDVAQCDKRKHRKPAEVSP